MEADDVADLYQLSVAIDLLEEPTRDTPAPDWPIDWGAVALIGGLVGAGLLVEAEGIQDLYQLSVATDLLAEPTRDAPEPDWPTDWGSIALRVALVVAALLVGCGAVLVVRRRRT